MNIAIIGNNYFGPLLAKQLNDFDKNNNYKYYDTNAKKIDKVKFFLNIVKIDIVYSIGATISGGGALKLALKMNKKIVQHFIGSDVLVAQEDFRNRRIDKKLVEKSRYLSVASWLQDELIDLNIESRLTPIMALSELKSPKKFDTFSVLTYMSKGREKFYGIEDFLFLANLFPSITFKIAGIDSWPDAPKNLKLLGWVDMIEELQNSTVYIRNAQHDGLAFTLLEALSVGRVVLYNHHFAHTHFCNNREELFKNIIRLKNLFEKGRLQPNDKAIEFISKEYEAKKVLSNLLTFIKGRE